MGGHLCPHWSATNGQLKHKNSCPYWGQGGLHRSVCTCSPSGLRWPCTGAGILFCTRRQKWTLSHLRGFEGRHGRYHGSEETEQWIIVSSRTLALQSHKWCSSCCSTQTTQFRLTGCSSPYWESQLHLEQGEPAASATSLQFQPSASLTLYPGYQTREVFLHLPF